MGENIIKERNTYRRWTLLVLLGFAILVTGFYMVWGFTTKRHLQSRIAALQQAGEPILPADFDVTDGDPSTNASVDILAAADLIDTDNPTWKTFNRMSPAPPLQADEQQAISKLIADSAASITRFEPARAKPRTVLEIKLRSPVVNRYQIDGFKVLGLHRTMAQLLNADLLSQFDSGDHLAAFKRLEDLLKVSRSADSDPSLVGHLTAIGVMSLATDRIAQIAPDLRIGTDPKAVSPQQVRRLIETLLDDHASTERLRLALRGERMVQLDMFQYMLKKNAPEEWSSNPTMASVARGDIAPAPLVNRSANLSIEYMNKMIPLVDETDFPAVRSKIPARPANSILNSFANNFLPSLSRALETHFRIMTERHLAAALLAARWYAVEHAGRYPQSLEELVPKYLPAVPTDPMASGATAIRYVSDSKSPLIYSVSVNGIDDGGNDSGRMNPRLDDWSVLDRVMHLTPQPRQPRGDLSEVEEEPDPSTTAAPAIGPATTQPQ